ncbi:putative sensor histidine kinase protein [Fulvivirga imtechensis AK7]|uniref:Putative sensor histidine kinase protein n=1 Tax=Fulvivirga imtechensis AK7 TaxID=1237149 RepID=L8JW08_9BACT|nr:response regulator [Fulvivirga imtechensis]ELR72985.1 putative sensor histidine kinase protein [Fulvivirga imtechensis AK7]
MLSQNKTILYLEDDEFTRLMVQAQLEQNGFSVHAFSDYKQLLGALSSNGYDIVVTDLNVNGYNAEELLGNIKSKSRGPVVVLTATDQYEHTADLTISKPLTSDKIDLIRHLANGESDDIDLSKVYQFACGDQELLQSYITTFIENYTNDLNELQKEIEKIDVTALQNRAHKMLSSVAYYGNKSLNGLLQKLETQGQDLTPRQLKETYAQIRALSGQLLENVKHKTSA